MPGFDLLPPEINSALMYSGPGSGPLLAAAASWSALGQEMQNAAAGYLGTINELLGSWMGPASASMTGAAMTQVNWLGTNGGIAEQTAAQAMAAASAYETAFAATVPPAAVTANRTTLAALVATNFLGQNTPAIMANWAQYFEMWAQDTAAMFGYAGASSSATQLTPFTIPPPATNPIGETAQQSAVITANATNAGNAVQTISNVLNQLSAPLLPATNALPANIIPAPIQKIMSTLGITPTVWGMGMPNMLTQLSSIGNNSVNGLNMSGWSSLGYGFNKDVAAAAASAAKEEAAAAAKAAEGAAKALPGAAGLRSAVEGAVGASGRVGAMSVPVGWAQAAADGRGPIVLTSAITPEPVGGANTMAGMPFMGTPGTGGRPTTAPRYGFVPKFMASPASAG